MNDLLLLLHLTGKFNRQKYLSLIEKYPNLSISDCHGSFLDIEWNKYLNIFEKIREREYISMFDSNYPTLLEHIPNSPIIIFYKGNLNVLNNRCVSIVGSRSPSSEGIKNTQLATEVIASSGVTIVSGMAMGIDSIAHSCAIGYPSSTIAVLASSVDEPTPIINTNLYQKILYQNGLILSENYYKGLVLPEFFPKRNRLIAGISNATVVIEAKLKSGSLITAKLARSYDRDVFAFPTSINSAYLGCNNLIYSQIAEIVPSILEIPKQLGLKINDNFEKEGNDNMGLTLQAQAIINFLIKNPGSTLDFICEKLNLSIIDAVTEIEYLKLSGQVIDEFGRFLVYNNSHG